MKRIILPAVLTSVSLGACANDHFAQNVDKLTAAGCKGSLHAEASAATAQGVSLGSADGKFVFDGACDPANRVPKPLPGPT